MSTVGLKLLVDAENNRVVLAESNKEFVDVLFSFLTLPMGTIIRLLNKQSSVGCIDKLYGSVESLNTEYFETEACKTMLLQPRSEAERLCEDLRVNADDLNPRRLYMCPNFNCFTKTNRFYSTICGARCHCGKAMDKHFHWPRKENDAKKDVFLKGTTRYVITDDLHVMPATATSAISLLQKLGINNADVLEERTVDISRNEVLSLLKSLLVSKAPFTDVFLQKKESVGIPKKEDEIAKAQIKSEVKTEDSQPRTVSVKLIGNRITEKVVYAEAGNGFVDVLLSFLTFPLGSIVKLLNNQSSVGCVDNLYNSVELLAATGDCVKSEECKNMLLSPKIYRHFNCENQIFIIEEKLPTSYTVRGCETCWCRGISSSGGKCVHCIDDVTINEINPKLQNASTESGGGYAKSSERFMVTNEMTVTPVSHISVIGVIKEIRAPISSLVENEVKLGEREVLNLLKACLISSDPLSQLFSHKKGRDL